MPIGYDSSVSERNIVPGYSSESDLEHVDQENPPVAHISRSRERKRIHYPRPHSHLFRTQDGTRLRGNRHTRRFENSVYLTTLHQIPEEDLEEDYVKVVPEHNTPLKSVLTNKEHQKIWHKFNELSEDEQEVMLSSSQKRKYSTPKHKQSDSIGLGNLDPHLRAVLVHSKRLPTEFIMDLEGDLREYFNDDERAVIVFTDFTSFQRMLVHAICQHTGLISMTFQVEDAMYLIVNTSENTFNPPSVLLYKLLH